MSKAGDNNTQHLTKIYSIFIPSFIIEMKLLKYKGENEKEKQFCGPSKVLAWLMDV